MTPELEKLFSVLSDGIVDKLKEIEASQQIRQEAHAVALREEMTAMSEKLLGSVNGLIESAMTPVHARFEEVMKSVHDLRLDTTDRFATSEQLCAQNEAFEKVISELNSAIRCIRTEAQEYADSVANSIKTACESFTETSLANLPPIPPPTAIPVWHLDGDLTDEGRKFVEVLMKSVVTPNIKSSLEPVHQAVELSVFGMQAFEKKQSDMIVSIDKSLESLVRTSVECKALEIMAPMADRAVEDSKSAVALVTDEIYATIRNECVQTIAGVRDKLHETKAYVDSVVSAVQTAEQNVQKVANVSSETAEKALEAVGVLRQETSTEIARLLDVFTTINTHNTEIRELQECVDLLEKTLTAEDKSTQVQISTLAEEFRENIAKSVVLTEQTKALLAEITKSVSGLETELASYKDVNVEFCGHVEGAVAAVDELAQKALVLAEATQQIAKNATDGAQQACVQAQQATEDAQAARTQAQQATEDAQAARTQVSEIRADMSALGATLISVSDESKKGIEQISSSVKDVDSVVAHLRSQLEKAVENFTKDEETILTLINQNHKDHEERTTAVRMAMLDEVRGVREKLNSHILAVDVLVADATSALEAKLNAVDQEHLSLHGNSAAELAEFTQKYDSALNDLVASTVPLLEKNVREAEDRIYALLNMELREYSASTAREIISDLAKKFEVDLVAGIQKEVDRIPRPRDGEDGKDGKDARIEPPVPYEFGKSYDAGRWVTHESGVWIARMLTKDEPTPGSVAWDCIVPGVHQIEVKLRDDERTLFFGVGLANGASSESDIRLPIPVVRGPFSDKQEYQKNDVVQYDGSWWQAQKDGKLDRPGASTDWRQQVRRGRDGKPGSDAKAAPWRHRGEWAMDQPYEAGDLVGHAGVNWLALKSTRERPPFTTLVSNDIWLKLGA